MNHRVKFIPGKYNVVHEGEVVGEAILDENGQVTEASLTSESVKQVDPNYNPVEGLSLAVDPLKQVDETAGVSIDLVEEYYGENQKGTFDA